MFAKTMRALALLTCVIIALYDKPSVPSCLTEEHGEIANALAAGESHRAVTRMNEYLNRVERNLELKVPERGPVDLDAALS